MSDTGSGIRKCSKELNMNFQGNLLKLTVVTDENVPCVYRYPLGKKDGNKLGRRKKELRNPQCIKNGNVLICHPTVVDIIIRQLTGHKHVLVDNIA